MLAIFHEAFAHPPDELHSPASQKSDRKPKLPEETLRQFLSENPANSFYVNFGTAAVLAYNVQDKSSLVRDKDRRIFCGYDNIYCLFKGSLNNLSAQIRQNGLTKTSNEAMVVIEAYRTLRDRGPYPADQVIKDLDGTFAFVVYDSKAGTVFAALGSDGGVKLYWGIAADGSVVISDDLAIIKDGCAKSYAPFPTGCLFHSDGGLMSFEHPMHKMRAMPRVDSEGTMCGANFKVDLYSRVNSIPRVGSQTNWVDWNTTQQSS